MALTFEELGRLLQANDISYWTDPKGSPRLLVSWIGMNGSYDAIISLQREGEFLQFRTRRWLHCPESHPHVDVALRVLGKLNYSLRFVKLGWDGQTAGEVVVYGDAWVGSNTITEDQMGHMLHNFFVATDFIYPRIQHAIEHGVDPGEDAVWGSFRMPRSSMMSRGTFVSFAM